MREDLLQRLRVAKNETEWNGICDEAKAFARTLPDAERSGQYPDWWFEDVLESGLACEVQMAWEQRKSEQAAE